MTIPSLNLEIHTPEVMESKKKKIEPEASDVDESFDYDQGFNIDEVYDQ